jgi:hypothetical protein
MWGGVKSRRSSLGSFLQPKHLSQHRIFEHLRPVFFPRCETWTSAPLRNRNSYNRLTACVNTSGSKAARQEILVWKVADFRWIQSVLHIFMRAKLDLLVLPAIILVQYSILLYCWQWHVAQ